MNLKFFFLLALMVLASISLAQEKKVRFENINIENGLSQSSVTAIIQDDIGFMWFATQDGLNRYDGYNFKIYRHNAIDSTSLSDNWINDLCEDQNGNIWIATENGLNKYIRKKSLFIRYTFQKQKIIHKNINTLFKDNNDNIWIGSRQGLSKISFDKSGKERFYHFDGLNKHFKPIANKNITSITQDLNGDIWIGTHSNGIVKFAYQKGETPFFNLFQSTKDKPNGLSDNHISKLHSDSNGNIWIGTNEGLNKYHLSTNSFVKYHLNINDEPEQIRGLLIDSKSFLWIGTHSNGIYRLNIKDDKITHFTHQEGNNYSLSNNNIIKAIYEDKTGIIWIGTLLGGVNKYDSSKFKFRHFKKGGNQNNSLPGNIIRSFYQDKNGFIWIGTENNGLCKTDTLFSNFTNYKLLTPFSNKLPRKRIYSITADSYNNLWIATMLDGVFKVVLDQKSNIKSVKNYKSYLESFDKKASLIVSNIFSDNDNNIWLCDYYGKLLKYNQKNDEFKIELNSWRDSLSVGIINDKPLCIKVDFNGNIWAGSVQQLICFNPNKKQVIKNYKYNPLNLTGLPEAQIKVIHQRINGSFWLGTNKGLVHFDPLLETFKLYNHIDGLPNDMIYGILEDKKGNLWLSTNKGISKFNIDNQEFENFDVSDGLQAEEFNTWAYYKTNEGKMLFGGINGLNAFFPSEIESNEFAPKISLTDFKLFNQKVLIKDKNQNLSSPLNEDISLTKSIELSYKDNVMTFEFSAFHFTAPKANKYAYKLEGFDNNWNYRNWDKRSVTYTNIEAGKYIFKVIASNNDGLWNKEGISLNITITPPLWKTLWFQILITSIILVILIAAYKFRTNQLKNRQAELKRDVLIKTARLRYQKEEITTQAEKLQMANNFIQAVNEDITLQKNELEKQKNEIELQADELKEAQKTIKEQNKKLQNTNFLLEDKVKKRTEQLEKAILELDHFIYRSAHDLRGPIARLLGLCNVGKLETKDENAIESFKRIEVVSKNMGNILDRLVRVQDIKDRVVKIDSMNINSIITQILSESNAFDQFSKEKSKVIIDEDIFINTDVVLFRILIENIILNAIQFRNQNKDKSYISISAGYIGDSKIVLWIRDNGMGIPDEIKEQVFDMFFIGTEKSEGPGLGLYEVKIIVEKLNGIISLSKSAKRETEFMLVLPVELINEYN